MTPVTLDTKERPESNVYVHAAHTLLSKWLIMDVYIRNSMDKSRASMARAGLQISIPDELGSIAITWLLGSCFIYHRRLPQQNSEVFQSRIVAVEVFRRNRRMHHNVHR